MTKNNKHSFKSVLALTLAALIAMTAFLTGCGSSEESSSDEKETSIVTETQVVTRVVNGVYTDEDGNPIKDENGQPMTAPSGTPDTKTDAKEKSENGGAQNSAANGGGNNGGAQNSAANGGGNNSGAQNSAAANGGNGGAQSSAANGGNSGSAQSSAADKSSKSDSKGGSSGGGNAGSDTLSIGGKSYNVGDTVTCTYTLTCKKLMANFQAYIDYDGKFLKPTNAYLDGPAKSGSVINYELYDKQKIKFNGINLNGYNYTKGANFLVVQYEVLAGGSSSPNFVWQISTDTKDNPLVVNGKPTSDISLSAAFS